MGLTYRLDLVPTPLEVIDLYDDAGLKRPTTDAKRIEEMIEHSNLIVTCWDNELLVGISRSLTDFRWCCYLADLAVRENYKKQGIGKEMIRLTKDKVGEETMVLLLSVDTALQYYPRVGLEKVENGFIINRSK